MIDRRLISQTDWSLLALAFMLAGAGLLGIFSSTHNDSVHIFHRQIFWLITGTCLMVPLIIVDYKLFERYWYLIYAAALLMLAACLLFGRPVGGAYRWISLGFISFQPSEFAKLAFIIATAKLLSTSNSPRMGLDLKGLMLPGIVLLVPFMLIAREPDLGTALIFTLVFCSMILIVKVRRKTMVGLVLALMPLIPIAWGSLKSYQKARVLSFLNPAGDPLGSGYHLLQSKIAIGSGEILGKGFTKGTQGGLKFLPEHHTDFIFSIMAEEWGFVGSLIILLLFLALIMRGINTARNAKDRFGFLVAFGITALFFWHIVINIGMTAGLLPVVGVPLPFLSYGGSFLVTTLMGVAILTNINMRRFIF